MRAPAEAAGAAALHLAFFGANAASGRCGSSEPSALGEPNRLMVSRARTGPLSTRCRGRRPRRDSVSHRSTHRADPRGDPVHQCSIPQQRLRRDQQRALGLRGDWVPGSRRGAGHRWTRGGFLHARLSAAELRQPPLLSRSPFTDPCGWANCGVEHRPDFGSSAPAIADVDGNGVRADVVGNVYNCGTAPYSYLYHMPFIFKLDHRAGAAAAATGP